MRYVHEEFRARIETELPPTLRMNPAFKVPATKMEEADFSPALWQNKLSTDSKGLLIDQCRAIVKFTCNYQRSRRSRMPGERGHLNDPTNLVLHELRLWVVTDLAHCRDYNEKFLQSVVARKRFVESLMNLEVFPPGRASSITMLSTLTQVRAQLRECTEKIRRRIASETTHQRIRKLSRGLEGVLLVTTQYLCRVLRDTKSTPACTTLRELRNWCRHKETMGVGEAATLLLRDLLTSPSILKLVPDKDMPQQTPCLGQNVKSLKPADGSWEQEEWVDVEWKAPPRAKDGTEYFRMGKGVTGYGVLERFRRDPEVIKAFVDVHTSISKIADLLSALRIADNVSTLGGQILLVGAAGGEMGRLLSAIEQLLNFLQRKVDVLDEITDHHFETLVAGQSSEASRFSSRSVSPTGDTPQGRWLRNHTEVLRVRWQLADTIEDAKQMVYPLATQVRSGLLRQQIESAKREAQGFLKNASAACNGVEDLLKTPILLHGVTAPKLPPPSAPKLPPPSSTITDIKILEAAPPRRIIPKPPACAQQPECLGNVETRLKAAITTRTSWSEEDHVAGRVVEAKRQ
uniref:Uncharacterized protein n=2 Tax=Lotharella globosa TaxID=91324 RepID=A0A7S4DTU7_9EUKA